MIVVIIALSIVVSIILVTAYEVIKSQRGGSSRNHINATTSFYSLPRKKSDTRKIKGDAGDDLAALNSCSYALWLRPNRDTFVGTTNNDWTVFYRGKGGNNPKYITMQVSRHGNLRVTIKTGTSNEVVTIASAIEIRRWNHVVICLDNMERFAEIYINGELLKTHNMSGKIVIDGGSERSPFKINPDNRKGYVRRVKYYPDVIGSEQVASLYKGDKMFTNITSLFVSSGGDGESSMVGNVVGNLKSKCDELERDKSNVERVRQFYEDGVTQDEVATAAADALKCKISFGKTKDDAGNDVDSRFICFERLPTCSGYKAAVAASGGSDAQPEVLGTCVAGAKQSSDKSTSITITAGGRS